MMPLRVRNVPQMASQNEPKTSHIFQTFSMPRFSCIMTECRKAVPKSQGIREAFSTGSHPHMVYEVIESRQPPPTSNILTDQIIRFTSKLAQQTFKHQLRRVVVWDEAHERQIVLVTNHFRSEE